jgi:hypothetical protein
MDTFELMLELQLAILPSSACVSLRLRLRGELAWFVAGPGLPVELRFVSFCSLGLVELQMDEERSLVILKGFLNMPIF